MEFPIYTISLTAKTSEYQLLGLLIMYFKGSEVEFSKFWCISIPEVIILANSADPDEMQHDAAFHLGLHCLPTYLFRGFQYTKG